MSLSTSRAWRTAAPLLAFAALLATPQASLALTSCKAKISPKDGAIQVSAKEVDGTLLWGNTAAEVSRVFANAATCLADGKANKCELGTLASAQRVTPPELCTIHLADSAAGTCSAYLKGCTPGLRNAAPGFVSKDGDTMSGPLTAFSLTAGFPVPGCGGGDVCAFSRLLTGVGGAEIVGDIDLGGSLRTGPNSAGAVKAALIVQCANASSITRSFNMTGTGAFSIVGNDFGECTVTAPFSVATRFVSATALDNSGGVNTAGVTVRLSGSDILVRRSGAVGTGEDGPVSILIY